MNSAIIIYGNVVDGLNFFGPFDDVSSAATWAEANKLDEWVVTELSSPSEFALPLCTCDAGGSAGCPTHDPI